MTSQVKSKYIAIVARKLMDDYGLKDWAFNYNKRKLDLGICFGERKQIQLSIYFVEHSNLDQINDILLHEIAHALVGCKHGHDAVWRAKAAELGAKPKQFCNSSLAIPYTYRAKCVGCLTNFGRHRLPKKGKFNYCKKCGPGVGYLEFKKVSWGS